MKYLKLISIIITSLCFLGTIFGIFRMTYLPEIHGINYWESFTYINLSLFTVSGALLIYSIYKNKPREI